jgi:DNA-binding CsgD family transcriptional regulator
MDTVSLDELARVSCDLGETIVDPSIWPAMMERICSAAGASGAVLIQGGKQTPDIPRTGSFDEALRFYFDNGMHMHDLRGNRGVPHLINVSPVVIDQDILTQDELRHPPSYYQEWLIPHGFQWFAAIGFYAGHELWAISLQRTIRQGPFQPDAVPALASLSRRLSEIATLSTAVGRSALTSATNALDRVQQPAVTLDRFGNVLDINNAASKIFDLQLYVRNRQLFTSDRQAQLALRKLISRLIFSSDLDPVFIEPIVIRRKGKGPVIVRPLPIHGAARNPFMGARALLTLAEVNRRPASAEDLLVKAYGLSKAEARLAARLATGAALEDIASELAIAVPTARSQLKAVFAKTDTHRQAELVALLSAL